MVNRNICSVKYLLCCGDSKAFQRGYCRTYMVRQGWQKREWCNKYRKKPYCAVSLGFPVGMFIHSCLLIDCELRAEIRFGFAFKAVSLFEVLSYENSISVSVLNLVSSLSRSKWAQPLEPAASRRWLASFPSWMHLDPRAEHSECSETCHCSWRTLSVS